MSSTVWIIPIVSVLLFVYFATKSYPNNQDPSEGIYDNVSADAVMVAYTYLSY